MERILLVEDDAQITASLSAFLQSEGFSVETATGETRARQLVEQTAPGLLLVDVQLAEGSGFGVCAYARSRGLPVIFLTASGDESSVVLGLDMGADDYIAKPFRPRELVSRIRSVLRRYGKEKTLVPLGGVMVDTEKGRVTRDGRDVYLSALEYRLLLVFLSHRGKVLSRSHCFFCLRNSMVYNRKTKCCGNVSNGKQVYAVRRRYRSIYYFNGN